MLHDIFRTHLARVRCYPRGLRNTRSFHYTLLFDAPDVRDSLN